jgi:hypothetical protein
MSKNPPQSVSTADGRRVRGWLLKGLLIIGIVYCLLTFTGRILLHLTIAQIIDLTNTKIDFESIDYQLNGSVSIENLVVEPYLKTSPDDVILKAQNLYARFGITSLLTLRPQLKELNVRDFIFNVQWNSDKNRWNTGAIRLKAPRSGRGKMPLIRLDGGTLKYTNVENQQVKTVAAAPVDAIFGPEKEKHHAYTFQITTAQRATLGKSTLTGSWKPGAVTLAGSIASADIPALERAWRIDVFAGELNYDRTGDYSLKLRIKDLLGRHTPTPESLASPTRAPLKRPGLFAALQRFFHRFRPAGMINIDLDVSGNLGRPAESVLRGKLHCKDVSICDRKFPYPVEHLVGPIDLTENSATLSNLCGWHNDVKLFFNGFSRDFGPDWKYQIRITSDNMALNKDLYQALSTKRKKVWDAFLPSGTAAIDYRLSRKTPTDKKKKLELELLDAKAAYTHFPYPLTNLTGKIFFEYDKVTVSNMVSHVNGRKITLNGKVTACRTDRPLYDISVTAEDIPLDSTLANALPPAQKDFYEQLRMSGLADADIKIFTPTAHPDPLTFVAEVFFKKTSLRDMFLQVPKTKQASSAQVKDNLPSTTFSDVSAKAIFTPEMITIDQFTGNYRLGDVALTGQIWPGEKNQQPSYQLQMRTEHVEITDDLIAHLPVSLNKLLGQLQPKGNVNLGINVNKAPADHSPDYKITIDCLGNTVHFANFPYPLKDITGSLIITPDNILLRDLAVTTAGDVRIMAGASAVKLNGKIHIPNGPSDIRQLDLSDSHITLEAESLKIKGTSLTAVEAGIRYDPVEQNWSAKNLVADCCGGRLAGKLKIKKSTETASQYLLQIGFENVDLKQFLSQIESNEPEPSNSQTSGKMDGSLSISTPTGENLPRTGRCRLRITDMQVGKLSPLAKLLYVLNLTEPKDFAFETMFVDSYIKDDKLFIQRFDLSGKAVAFCGSGRMDLKSRNLDLTLAARGPRLATAEPSVLQSLTDTLGQAVVRMEVTGDYYDPHVKTIPLPLIEDSLRIFGPEQTRPNL